MSLDPPHGKGKDKSHQKRRNRVDDGDINMGVGENDDEKGDEKDGVDRAIQVADEALSLVALCIALRILLL